MMTFSHVYAQKREAKKTEQLFRLCAYYFRDTDDDESFKPMIWYAIL